MKQITIWVALAGVLVFTNRCKKDNSGSGAIQGEWELRKASGMLVVNYPAGNGKKIKFQGNQYEMSENGQITQSGTYDIVPDGTVSESTCLVIPNGKYTRRIVYNNTTINRKIFLELDGNKLYFISGCFAYDAGSVTEYVRIKNL